MPGSAASSPDVHEQKVDIRWYLRLEDGTLQFYVIKNKNVKTGDFIRFLEQDENGLTGRQLVRRIGLVIYAPFPGIIRNYAGIQLEPADLIFA